jgi:hypothetical protein
MSAHRLVVSRFRENVDWVDCFGAYTIYNKGRDDLAARHRANSIRLPNVGREAHTYIHHIVENYDRLEDIMIFSQGGYRAHAHFEPEEFLRRALDLGDLGFSVNLGDINGFVGSNSRDFMLRWHGVDLHTKEPYDLGGWWERATGEPWVRSRSVFWGATFSVRREFILRRSRESYASLLKTLDWATNPMEAHFCERAWFNILNLPFNYVKPGNPSQRSAVAPAPPLDKDPSFDLDRVVEKWEGDGKQNAPSKIVVRFGSSRPAKSVDREILTREELLGALDHVGDLMSRDEATVRKVTRALRDNVEGWTRAHCPRYPLDKPYISKGDLEEKDGWYAEGLVHESMEVGTTGSTTGNRFKYMRWHPTFHKIEWDYHYNLVLDEFGVREDPNILYFFSDHYRTDGSEPIACFGGKSDLAMNNHGSSRSPVVHYANFAMYQRDNEGFWKYLFEYVRRHRIDVFFTSSPQISSMCNYIRKFGVKHRIGHLLSNTGDRILPADAYFLFIENDYFAHVCDHMRCWDGGATFYTCRERNYHLMDNLSWVEEIEGRMICTDYFNLASPFVRYWNGDYCKVGKEYQRCECGRLYREFEFLESRPFSLKGVCMKDIKEGIKALNISGIREVRCSTSHLDVVSVKDMSPEDQARISALTDRFRFRFLTEEFHS